MRYQEDIYDESFKNTLNSFDEYVQESALMIGGLVAGIGACVALVVLLIKKIFFSKQANSGANSIVGSLKSIQSKLENFNKDNITFEKGFNTSELVSGIKAILAFFTELNGQDILKIPPEKIKSAIDKVSAVVNKKVDDIFKEGSQTYETASLKSWVTDMIKCCQQVATQVKNYDKAVKIAEKDSNLSDEAKKQITASLKVFTEGLNNQKALYSELSRQVNLALQKGNGDQS